ncbi:MAG: O-antigen ligase family protein [Planctomycetaceae bacterium]|nr:O-antigen ligase family protein [Planctomycetaceae bacterium]
MVVVLLLVALLVLGILNKRWLLLSLFVSALMFSGHVHESLDSGSTLLRWAIMFVLALTAFNGMANPGIAAVMLGIMATWGIATSFLSVSTFYAVQKAGLLFVLALPMAAVMADRARTERDVRIFLMILMCTAGLFMVLGVQSLGSLRGARYAGAISSAPLFVLTGGLLAPVMLWGAMSSLPKYWRIYSAVVLAVIVILCVLSGQRTGTFAGFIACLPLLLGRFGIKRLLLALVVVIVIAVVANFVLDMMPAQKEFVIRRFTSADTTGRTRLWMAGLGACLKEPFVGHGSGMAATLGFGTHNAFLNVWYELGLPGLVLFAGAMITMLVQSVKQIISGHNPEGREYGRLFLGLMMGSLAAAFFEAKLDSPSNVAVFMMVITSVMLTCLRNDDTIAAAASLTVPEEFRMQQRALAPGLLIQSYYG